MGRLIGTTTSYSYDADNEMTLETDAASNVWATAYNALGQAWLQTDPLGEQTREYFDADGTTIRRREYCYDDTGDVNAVEHYEKGHLVSREFDAAGRRKIDTWDTFDPNAQLDPKTGRPAHPLHRERDTSGDGKVDQWWTWNGDKVTIAIDRTGDGKPDPDTAIVLGPDNSIQTPPPPPDTSTAPASAAPTSAAPPATGTDAKSVASAPAAASDGGHQ